MEEATSARAAESSAVQLQSFQAGGKVASFLMPPPFPQSVVEAIAEARVLRLLTARENFESIASEAPRRTAWAVLIPLIAQSREELNQRLVQISCDDDSADWVFVTGEWEDGGQVALASNLVGGIASPQRYVHLQLFDLHPRMIGWYLTALWRARELTDDLIASLGAWHVVASAALSRSLFEGAFAFVAEAGEMADAWYAMKATGPPDTFAAEAFGKELERFLLQAQLGTRIGERGVRRTAIKTMIDRGIRRADLEQAPLDEQYNWLCDAVHPSYGFQTAALPGPALTGS